MTAIAEVRGRQIWDSRGRPTVEVEVTTADGSRGRAIAPAGASRGSAEAVDLRDPGEAFGGYGVDRAVAAVNGEIRETLMGRSVFDQPGNDAALRALDGTEDKSRLGGNALVATSLACLHTSAAAAGTPLWQYLAAGAPVRLPLPEIQVFGGGAHAGRRIDIQDLMIMTPRAGSFRRALEISAAVYRAAGLIMEERGLLSGTADEGGWWPGFASNEQALETLALAIERAGFRPGEDVWMSLDIAASEFSDGKRYRLALEDRVLDRDAMLDLLQNWTRRFPILSIEDPLHESDRAGTARCTALLGGDVQIIGDDYLVTRASRVRRGIAEGACNAVLLKVNQAGTVSETREAFEAARDAGWGTVVSARSGESEDVSIAHLAVGWNAGQFKVGSMTRGERTAKWNEMLRIEEALGGEAYFAGAEALPKSVSQRLI